MKNQKWLLALGLMASTSLYAQNYALSFDGVNDYVSLGNDASVSATNIKTVEAWVKFNSLTNGQEIISKSAGSNGLELLLYNNGLAAYVMNSAAATASVVNYPFSNLTTGVWYHIAFTWDGTKESMRLYVNGISVGTRTDYGNINTLGIGNPAGALQLGNWTQPNDNRFFNGAMDEVRIWSTPRTASEIAAGMNGTVEATTVGLTAYYKMNEGSGTSVANTTLNTAVNGTLVNGPSWTLVSGQYANNALAFDGIDDVVSIGKPIADNGSYTKEAWVYLTNTASSSFNIISSNQVALWVGGNRLLAGNNGGTADLTDPGVFPANAWVHVAVSYDAASSTMRLYRDGLLVSSGTVAKKPVSENNYIGAWFNGTANAAFFQGKIEEVRVWNTALSQSAIRSNMFAKLSGTEGNLVRLYNFDNGLPGSNNANLTSLSDGSTSNAPGTLFNFALSGTTSNWVASPVQKGHNGITLDGVDDYMVAPAKSQLDITIGTIECWVRPGTLTGNATIIANRQSGTRFSFHMTNSNIGFWNGTAYVTVPFVSNVNQWYHLAFVCRAGAVDVYVNGGQIGTFNQGVGTATGQPLYIGYNSGGEPFNGAFDEVRIWNVARTQPEIFANMQLTLTGSEANLVALYNFNSGIGGGNNVGLQPVLDISSTANTGRLTNMVLDGATSNYIIDYMPSPAVAAATRPTITSFTPTVAAPGGSVVITGTGFNTVAARNVVYFGATQALVNAASATQLTVTVPQGATFHTISVTNSDNGLTASSARMFSTTFSETNFSMGNKLDFQSISSPRTVALGDLDGDGKSDVVVGANSGSVIAFYKNNSTTGTLVLSAKVDLIAGSNPEAVKLADMNGDGRLDLLVANSGSNFISLFRNTSTPGNISFASRTDLAVETGSGIRNLATGDLNADGIPELVAADFSRNSFVVFKNNSTNGAFSFSAASSFLLGASTSPNAIAMADFNGDGNNDIATLNTGNNTISIWRNNSVAGGSVSMVAQMTLNTGAAANSLVAGDLNDDGKVDLAFATGGSMAVSYLLNNTASGSFAFGTRTDVVVTTAPQGLALGDVTGDGKPDLVTSLGNLDKVGLLVNTGNPVTPFNARDYEFEVGDNPYGVQIGDLNNDSKSDIIVADGSGAMLSVLQNTSSESTLPLVLVQFQAIKQGASASLTWTTSLEVNTSHFEVERSLNGTSFTRLTEVAAAGNTATGNRYAATDQNPAIGMNYYRLKMVDKDGAFTYSPVVSLQWKQAGFVTVNIAPQPVQSAATISVAGFKGQGTLVLFNSQGGRVQSYPVRSNGDRVYFSLSGNGLAPGVYYYKLFADNGSEMSTGKFLVQ